MEYLMTYGWAILIISVVLASLWSLGIFSINSNAGKAPPGSCRVFRPSASVSNTYTNLVGVCTSQAPQYAAQFDGVSSYVDVGPALTSKTYPLSFVFWVKPSAISQSAYLVDFPGTSSPISIFLDYGDNKILLSGALPDTLGLSGISTYLPVGVWKQLAIVYTSNSNVAFYLNGAQQTVSSTGFYASSSNGKGDVLIGGWTTGFYFPGSISNLQVYNASLDANTVRAMYAEGIGGDPINLQNLIGWWPLNGDAKDYSGSNNNGAPTNVIFTTSWTK
jgi:hypothetical protein